MSLTTALAGLRAGRPVLVADAANREDEVDAIFAAREMSTDWMAWLIQHSSGFICAPLPSDRADLLGLPPMVSQNQDPRRTAYTVSVDAARGITTGISAADRARTVRVLAAPDARSSDLIRPGHILPLRARVGGLAERQGHTEAAVALVALAGVGEVGVIAELVTADGRMMRAQAAREFAVTQDLPFLTVAEIAATVAESSGPTERRSAPLVEHNAVAALPTAHGKFTIHAYTEIATGIEHVVLVAQRPSAAEPLVRLHSECLTGDAFGSLRCDCGPQLAAALERVANRGGAVVHLGGQEGRGIGLAAKIAAYALQDVGRDTVEANEDLGLPVDARSYEVAAAMLRDLGMDSIQLLTNNPAKATELRAHGINVVGREPLAVGITAENRPYLLTKQRRMGHKLGISEPTSGTAS